VGPPPKKSRTGLIVTLVIVAVLVVGGGGVAAFLLLKDDNSNSAGGGGTPREAADAFVAELGTQLSKPVGEVDLGPLRSLTCGSDYNELNNDLSDAREKQSSATKKPDAKKVSFAISNFKESGDGASFDMTPKADGDAEGPLSMTVVKENTSWVVCGLYKKNQEEAPGSSPSSGEDAPSISESIPNPIPKTS
jgi:hypothetical protein